MQPLTMSCRPFRRTTAADSDAWSSELMRAKGQRRQLVATDALQVDFHV
jgi:hypothetical protein